MKFTIHIDERKKVGKSLADKIRLKQKYKRNKKLFYDIITKNFKEELPKYLDGDVSKEEKDWVLYEYEDKPFKEKDRWV